MFSQETTSRVIRPYFKHKREKGNKGEDIACVYLERQGFKVIVRNYQKKWGELDIIAQKDAIIHFFEVKSVIVETFDSYADSHRPEENVHAYKGLHIRRMIETFLGESKRGLGVEFHFHVLCVYMNANTRRARIKWIKDVIL
jgi:Holliday junction resolvase-like predicted endonuclease